MRLATPHVTRVRRMAEALAFETLARAMPLVECLDVYPKVQGLDTVYLEMAL